tara:strand:- start:572 stop:1078 length:507 start_codon:yes stop_codon:yes gene_type:complete
MDKILELLGMMQFTKPKAHDNIDSLMQNNQSMNEQTIGPIPETMGGLSQQDLLEMITGSGGAGGMLNKIGAGLKHSTAVPKSIDNVGGLTKELTKLLPKNPKHFDRIRKTWHKYLTKTGDDGHYILNEKPFKEGYRNFLDWKNSMNKYKHKEQLTRVGEFLKKKSPFD